MVLSNEQVQSLIKTPRNAANLRKAIEHEDRLKFHGKILTNTFVATNGQSLQPESIADLPYYSKFLSWVKGVITASDKYEQFKKMLVFPLKTNEIVDVIADEYSKVFDAEDAFSIVEFKDSDLKDDFQKYLESIKEVNFWHNDAFNAMLTSINSVIIVDLPSQQLTERPAPYFYLLDIRNVVDYQVNRNNEFEYIIFKDSEKRIAVFDDVFYRIYEVNNDVYSLVSESAHNLGFCPAKSFWSDTLDKKNPINKQSPLSASLERMDWQLFFDTAKESLDIYAAYPIYWAYASKCDYKDQRGNSCSGGIVVYQDENSKRDLTAPCPVCTSKGLTGAGSFIEVPISRGDISLQLPPAGVISIDKDSLDYNVNESERLKAQIITGATGKMKLLNKQAVNQDQMQSQFENQTNILNWIARNFEQAHKWTYDTICQLRYGDAYLGCSINYGTNFYLQTINDAIKDFNNSKTAGVPSYILMSKLRKIEHLQSKNNPQEKNRIEILRYIEPFPLMTLKECKDLGFDTIDKEGFVLKANFANFVSKFELEYGSILEFGSALDFSTKIERIITKIKDYGRQQLAISSEPGQGQETIPGSKPVGIGSKQPGSETQGGQKDQAA